METKDLEGGLVKEILIDSSPSSFSSTCNTSAVICNTCPHTSFSHYNSPPHNFSISFYSPVEFHPIKIPRA
ncbi:hypothetical protein E2C01_069429 [Portunus trituberculatus]|uniref:Uncharacterized protein n=1 Tax=Portunus trituberculatus TaxID=210409 RepID=A0A5B7HYV4_PORTR|nr:hypothetical protein [Portunus trituberculatus]